MKKVKKLDYAARKKAFDATLQSFRDSQGCGLGAMQYNDSCGGSRFEAKPTPTDFRCDVARVLLKLVVLKSTALWMNFKAAYIEYDSDDQIEREQYADKILGSMRHNLEQEIGGEFIRRHLFPAQGKGGYFTAIRKARGLD